MEENTRPARRPIHDQFCGLAGQSRAWGHSRGPLGSAPRPWETLQALGDAPGLGRRWETLQAVGAPQALGDTPGPLGDASRPWEALQTGEPDVGPAAEEELERRQNSLPCAIRDQVAPGSSSRCNNRPKSYGECADFVRADDLGKAHPSNWRTGTRVTMLAPRSFVRPR